jgi:hypothetical protein
MSDDEFSGVGRSGLIAIIRMQRDLIELHKQVIDDHKRRLQKRVDKIGICIRGWWCICDRFNGEEQSKRNECSACGRAKTVRATPAVQIVK